MRDRAHALTGSRAIKSCGVVAPRLYWVLFSFCDGLRCDTCSIIHGLVHAHSAADCFAPRSLHLLSLFPSSLLTTTSCMDPCTIASLSSPLILPPPPLRLSWRSIAFRTHGWLSSSSGCVWNFSWRCVSGVVVRVLLSGLSRAEGSSTCARGGSVSVRASHLSRFAWHFDVVVGCGITAVLERDRGKVVLLRTRWRLDSGDARVTETRRGDFRVGVYWMSAGPRAAQIGCVVQGEVSV